MIFVQRNDKGEIVGVFLNKQPGFAEEVVEKDSEEVVSYFNKAHQESVAVE